MTIMIYLQVMGETMQVKVKPRDKKSSKHRRATISSEHMSEFPTKDGKGKRRASSGSDL